LVRVLCFAVLAATLSSEVAGAQEKDSAAVQKLKDAAKEGFPLKTNFNVSENVSVEAVLLPEKVCRRVFGKEISQNYATIELTISNRSRDASLIVQSLFIDYSNWILSGNLPWNKSATPSPATEKQNDDSNSANLPETWNAGTKKNQISSVEYRIARGQLLDRQPWTLRNTVVHSLQLVGTIASAYVFTVTDTDIIRGVNAFNGQVIPGVQTFWPDGTIAQMNRISDFGFQVNKVIPKEGSDIIVAFFPIDRFLTPGLRKLFLRSPALFFAPFAMALDPEAQKELAPLIAPLVTRGKPRKYLSDLTGRVMKGTPTDEDKKVVAFLNSASLNTVKVLVGGIMTVDVSSIPANITSIEMEEGNDNAASFKKGDHKGIIHGSFLLTGTPQLVGGPSDAKLTIVQSNSNDTSMHFTLSLGSDVDAAKFPILTFRVVKKDKNNQDVVGMTKDLAVMAQPAAASSPSAPAATTPPNSEKAPPAVQQQAAPPATQTPPPHTPPKS